MSASPQIFYSREFYKPSRYNIVANTEDGLLILYNSLSGARIVVKDKSLFSFISSLERNKIDYQTNIPDDLIQFFVEASFIVPSKFDELEYILHHVHISGQRSELRRITVILTKRCNLGCAYCFQAKVDPEEANNYKAVKQYLFSQIVPNGAMQVTWFGGEPTLRIKAIEMISDDIIDACMKDNCNFRATISSNGVLLDDPKKVIILRRAMVEQFQITLDGPQTVQERRRPSLNKKSTYYRILEGIENVVVAGGTVIIKVIVDTESAEYVPFLFLDLRERELLNKVKIAIQETESKFAADGYGKRFPDEAAFASVKTRLLKNLSELGYPLSEPERKDEYCAATSPFTSVIDASGRLYRCGTERENYVGVVDNTNVVIKRPEYEKVFVKNTQLRLDECNVCKVLPICGGGCTLGAQKMANRGVCSFYRYAIRDYLGILEGKGG